MPREINLTNDVQGLEKYGTAIMRNRAQLATVFENLPPSAPVKQLQIAEANLASEFYKRLVEWINKFDATLESTDEVGVRLVNFGETVKFHLRDMSYYDPSLISFQGELDDGSQVELIQHVSQISILLMKLPRKNPNEPKRQIGFHVPQE